MSQTMKKNDVTHVWSCSNCSQSNKYNMLFCSKCKTGKSRARPWKCGKCEKMMAGGVVECPDCQLDINGFIVNW